MLEHCNISIKNKYASAAGGGSLSISGGTIPASSLCLIEVDLTATAALTGTTAWASITVLGAPSPSFQLIFHVCIQ